MTQTAEVLEEEAQDQKSDELRKVPFSEIEVDEEFNARIGEESYRNVPELAESIMQTGQQQPVTLMPNKKGAAKPYFLVAGFRRMRAFGAILKETKAKDILVNATIKHFEGKSFDERAIEAKYANLATDAAVEPLRDYEYAMRCHYFKSRLGASQAFIAKQIGKHQTTVSVYLKLIENLSPDVKTAWASAPDPSKEIPVYKLQQWAKRPPSEQKVLLDKYQAGDDTPTEAPDSGSKGGDKPPARIDGGRPGLRAMKAELEKIEAKREKEKKGSVDDARLEGASKALRYAMGEITRIF